jgi:hypothetical protein
LHNVTITLIRVYAKSNEWCNIVLFWHAAKIAPPFFILERGTSTLRVREGIFNFEKEAFHFMLSCIFLKAIRKV